MSPNNYFLDCLCLDGRLAFFHCGNKIWLCGLPLRRFFTLLGELRSVFPWTTLAAASSSISISKIDDQLTCGGAMLLALTHTITRALSSLRISVVWLYVHLCLLLFLFFGGFERDLRQLL